MQTNFIVIFWALLMGWIVMSSVANADCPDCGMSNHEYYGGR